MMSDLLAIQWRDMVRAQRCSPCIRQRPEGTEEAGEALIASHSS